jgi:hypothetical protein
MLRRAFMVTFLGAWLAACAETAAAPAPPSADGSTIDSFDSSTLGWDGDATFDASVMANEPGRDGADRDRSILATSDGPDNEAADAFAPTGDATAADGIAPDAPATPGPNVTFSPFTNVYVFGDHDGGSQRSFDVTVNFPPMPLTYRTITLRVGLQCPNAAVHSCDYVDQRGFVGVVQKNGNVETVYEIQRFITPYGSPVNFTADVTSLRPLLSGPVVLRLWVDTWAHPGSNMGEGWRVYVTFDFVGGVPARWPIAVLPLWGETIFDFGDPAKPQPYIAAREVTVPREASGVELRSFITGHGQGNSENCGEFCPKNHTFTIGGRPFTRSVWRTDCASTASRGQTSGAYVYPRAGWCPGATVLPWVEDVTAAAPAGQPAQVSYSVEPYTNTCQPGVCTLMSCAFFGTPYFNGSCIYDQQFHAVPYYVLSSLLVAYGN